MKKFKSYFTLSVILFFNISVFAQQEEYRFEKLSIDDGLSQSSVKSILQDKTGFMWIGTASGLNRYDGYSFKVYESNPLNPSSFFGNTVTAMYEDKKGRLWFGTSDGYLNRYIGESDSFIHYILPNAHTLPPKEYYELPLPFSRSDPNAITSIAEDKNGNLWVGSWGNGIARFDEAQQKFVDLVQSENISLKLFSLIVSDLIIDKDGVFWLTALGEGFIRMEVDLKSNRITDFILYPFDAASGKKLTGLITMLESKTGDIWIGSLANGIYIFPRIYRSKPSSKDVRFINYNASDQSRLNCNSVFALMEDHNGFMWAGTFGDGVKKFDGKARKFVLIHNSGDKENSPNNDIISLYEDRAGMVWVGAHLGMGIVKIETNQKKFYVLNQDVHNGLKISDDVVWSVYEDKSGNLWVGTYRGGLNKINRKTGKTVVYKHNPTDRGSISQNYIRSIAEDKDGNLWIGTYSEGLNLLRKNSGVFEKYKFDPKNETSIGGNQVQYIYVAKDSVIWIATFGGGLSKAVRSRNGGYKFIRYLKEPGNPNSLCDNRVYTIFEDSEGVMWVGTFGGGLNKFDRKTGKFFAYKEGSAPSSISDDKICVIYEDKFGAFWIGTYGGGLNKFNKKTGEFKRYTTGRGGLSRAIYGILEDNNNNLWLSSDNGLIKFNMLAESYVDYDLFDGIQSDEFNGGAYFQNKKGEMFFGGVNGLNYFHPEDVKDNPSVPHVVITSVNYSNIQKNGYIKELVLNYNQNFISFEFAALDYHFPLKNVYAYKLEGIDDTWRFTNGQRRYANYTNLQPGEYIFKVKGSNNDGIWNETGAEMRVIILNPYWKRWWFITLYLVVLGGIIVYFATLRLRNAAAIRELKERLSADLHDNIGSGLTEISILSELAMQNIQNDKAEAVKKVKSISETSRLLIDAMSDIIWVVNPRTDSLYDLFVRLKTAYSDLLSSLGISFKCGDMDALKNVKLSMEHRQNLFLIFKEGINNSIKHSGCKNISFNVKFQGKILEIILKDDGVGFDDKNPQYGNGLANMKKRTKNIGGEILWNASVNGGSEIIYRGRLKLLKKPQENNLGITKKYNLKDFHFLPNLRKRIL
ncbi:MAG TPA: two-component regulator propeller domain-containing protein [Ignavibacteriales bacterium]|nr:two-component regulator propeller domain-containing protein [Ignavibacteriales bacterium]